MIPKVIHYCWFGGSELPEYVERCIQSWKKFCPEYQIKRWDESNYNFEKYPFCREAYQKKKWAFVSDVARLDIVYSEGGIYLDTDVELIKCLDDLLIEHAFMGFERGRLVATGLGFGGEKGNPVIKANLESYLTRQFTNEDETLDLTPCPVITTDVLEMFGLKRVDQTQDLGDVKIFSSDYFCPMLLSDGTAEIRKNTYSIHHYAGSWTTEAEKKQVQKRTNIYTKYGKYGLKVYDAWIVLKEEGIGAFMKRMLEACKRILIQ